MGRPYHPVTFDCADLVAAVLREEFAYEVSLPGRAATLRGRDRQIQDVAYLHGRPVPVPAEGDVVLMRAAGRQRGVGHHVGLWCLPDGATHHVLHCVAGLGTCLHPVAGLAARGYELRGVYRCR